MRNMSQGEHLSLVIKKEPIDEEEINAVSYIETRLANREENGKYMMNSKQYSQSKETPRTPQLYDTQSKNDNIEPSSSNAGDKESVLNVEDGKYTCSVCFKGFLNMETFHTHQREHVGETTEAYECGVCSLVFFGRPALQAHMASSDHSDRTSRVRFSFECMDCNTVFGSRDAYAMHMMLRAKDEKCGAAGQRTIVNGVADYKKLETSVSIKEESQIVNGKEESRLDYVSNKANGRTEHFVCQVNADQHATKSPDSTLKDLSADEIRKSTNSFITEQSFLSLRRRCLLCGELCVDQDSLAMHVMSDHTDEVTGFTQDKLDSSDSLSGKSHQGTHDTMSDYLNCRTCRLTFGSRDALAMHILCHTHEMTSPSTSEENFMSALNSAVSRKRRHFAGDLPERSGKYDQNHEIKDLKMKKYFYRPNRYWEEIDSIKRQKMYQNNTREYDFGKVSESTIHGHVDSNASALRLLNDGRKSHNWGKQILSNGNICKSKNNLRSRSLSADEISRPKSVKQVRPFSTGSISTQQTTNAPKVDVLRRREREQGDITTSSDFDGKTYENMVEKQRKRYMPNDGQSYFADGPPVLNRVYLPSLAPNVATDLKKTHDVANKSHWHTSASGDLDVVARSDSDGSTTSSYSSRRRQILRFLMESREPFICRHCEIIFVDKTMYHLHMGLHNVNNPWQCNICGQVCKGLHEFAAHNYHC